MVNKAGYFWEGTLKGVLVDHRHVYKAIWESYRDQLLRYQELIFVGFVGATYANYGLYKAIGEFVGNNETTVLLQGYPHFPFDSVMTIRN